MIRVFDELEAEGLKPCAECWTSNLAYFTNRALGRVLEHWCDVTGHPVEFFPFTEDAIRETWISWRKAGGEKERRIRDELFGDTADDSPGLFDDEESSAA